MSLEALRVGNATGHAEQEGMAGWTWHGFPCTQEQHRHTNPGTGEGRGKVGIRDSHRGCGGTREGPSPPAHTSFHLCSDTKENLFLERHSSFLALTQILHSGLLEPPRSLNSVLFPYYHTKPSWNALLFTGLLQPCQEGITECDPHFRNTEDALTAQIQLPRMSTVPICRHLHPPISRVLDTGRQLWQARPATYTLLQQKHAFLESHSQVTTNPGAS